jgi:hypothetical protein
VGGGRAVRLLFEFLSGDPVVPTCPWAWEAMLGWGLPFSQKDTEIIKSGPQLRHSAHAHGCMDRTDRLQVIGLIVYT